MPGQPFLYKLGSLLRSTTVTNFVFCFGAIHNKSEQMIGICTRIAHLPFNFIVQPDDFNGEAFAMLFVRSQLFPIFNGSVQ